MWLRKVFKKSTYIEFGECIKGWAMVMWNQIKRIRNLPTYIRAAIVLVLYTLATKLIEGLAEVLDKMNNLLTTNMTAFTEYINTSNKEVWIVILQTLLILVFVAIASWLWDSNIDKKVDKLDKKIDTMKSDIIEEIHRDKQR